MRTTLVIDDDVMVAAKAIAEHEHRSLGAVISDLARRALHPPRHGATRNGIPLLATPPDAAPVTLDIVNALRDDLP